MNRKTVEDTVTVIALPTFGIRKHVIYDYDSMTQVLKDTESLNNWNEFVSALSKNGLTLLDLVEFGLTRKSQLNKIKDFFKGKEKSKRQWNKFKLCHDIYYFIVRASPDVAYSNKKGYKQKDVKSEV